MGESELHRETPEKQPVSPGEVWGQLEQATRDRVIELFAQAAYKYVIARCAVPTKEGCDVCPRLDG